MTVAHLYPNINPSLLLDFANVKALDPRITFTRASNALYYDNSGVLRSAVDNQARFDYNPVTGQSLGLLIEEQRTNLYLRSAIFNASWNTTTATINTANSVSPNRLIEAAQIVSDVGSVSGQIRQSTTKAANAITHTASVYAKTDGLETLSIQVEHAGNTSNRAVVKYSLLDGSELITANTIGTFTNAVSSIHAVANSWFRISLTFTTGTETTIQTRIGSDKISGNGDGTSGVYLWGAQLEAGAFPTSYVRTEASQVTRAADAASITNANFSSWYRADEGSLYAEASTNQTSFTITNDRAHVITLASEDSNNALEPILFGTGAILLTRDNGTFSNAAVIVNGSVGNGLSNKLTVTYTSDGNAQVALDGQLSTTLARPFQKSEINQMLIGNSKSVANRILDGHVRKISYYPQRLTPTQLQALTR